MESTTTLRGNLERLRRRHPAVARSVERASSEGIEVLECRNGSRTLACDGVLLASRHDPAAEGEQIARDVVDRGVDLWITIGFSLGHQIEAARRSRRLPLVVFEPAPARLRGALALRPDLEWIEDSDVCFAEDTEALADAVARHYMPGLRLHVTVHPSALRLDPKNVKAAVARIGRVKDSIDTVAATRVGAVADWTRMSVENAAHYLKLPIFSSLGNAFRGRPAVIAAAGPSLDKQLPALARVADRALVFAVGPSLGALRAGGIRPDLVHVLESSDVAHQLVRSGPTDDLDLVLTPKVHPGLFDLPVRNRFVAYTAGERFAWWIAEQLGETQGISSAGSVAMGAVLLAASLGADPILLIGQDLAFTDGRVYAGGSCYRRIGFELEKDGGFRYTNMRDRLEAYGGDAALMETVSKQRTVWVEGVNGEPVPTSVAYAAFREGFRGIAAEIGRYGIRLINCTEGGALIPGLEHRAFESALAEFATEAFDAPGTIQRAADAVSPIDVSCFEAPLRRARQQLRRILGEARRGTRNAEATLRRLRRTRDRRTMASELRRLASRERQIHRHLEATPWLEGLVQAELHAALPLLHRADRDQPTPEEALEECVALMRAAAIGCERATELFDLFEKQLLDGRP